MQVMMSARWQRVQTIQNERGKLTTVDYQINSNFEIDSNQKCDITKSKDRRMEATAVLARDLLPRRKEKRFQMIPK